MATACAWCVSAVVKIATESEITRFFFYPGPIRVLSGSLGSTKNHIISDSVQVMATTFAWCISAVVKIATGSEIIRFFFYPGPIWDLSGFYPGVSDRQKIHIISDPFQIMATVCAWCVSAVVKIATESEITRFFFYPGPIRVLSGSLGSTKNHIISDSV